MNSRKAFSIYSVSQVYSEHTPVNVVKLKTMALFIQVQFCTNNAHRKESVQDTALLIISVAQNHLSKKESGYICWRLKKEENILCYITDKTRVSLDISLSCKPQNMEWFTQHFQSSIQHENTCFIIICDGSETIKKHANYTNTIKTWLCNCFASFTAAISKQIETELNTIYTAKEYSLVLLLQLLKINNFGKSLSLGDPI